MRSALRSALGLALMLVAGCHSGTTIPVATDARSPAQLPTPTVAASPSPSMTPSTVATSGRRLRATGEDAKLADAFVALALSPGTSTADALPVPQDGIHLGLGPHLLKALPADEIGNPASWQINPRKGFRAWTGPFSALKDIRFHVEHAGDPRWLRPSGELQYLAGPHPHCAGPPQPAPTELENLQRISIQPAADSITTCVAWFTVDMFVNEHGDIVAVTFDRWEP